MTRPTEAPGLAAAFVSGGWLRLAAAPGFAFLALRAAVLGGGAADFVCSARHETALLDGMAPMYALMALAHAPPWIAEARRRYVKRSMR